MVFFYVAVNWTGVINFTQVQLSVEIQTDAITPI